MAHPTAESARAAQERSAATRRASRDAKELLLASSRVLEHADRVSPSMREAIVTALTAAGQRTA